MRFVTVIFIVALVATPSFGVVVDKPLFTDTFQGSTVGVQRGDGKFVSGGGWRSQGGNILYDYGKVIRSGYAEFMIDGYTAPAQGVDKTHLISGWEHTSEPIQHHNPDMAGFWGWRVGTSYNPFKLLASPNGLNNRVEEYAGSNAEVNNGKQNTYRVQWRSGTIKFIYNGNLLQEWKFSDLGIRRILIGRDDLMWTPDPAPIFRHAEIGEMIDAPPTPTPTPKPPPKPTPTPKPSHDGHSVGCIHLANADDGTSNSGAFFVSVMTGILFIVFVVAVKKTFG